MRREPVFVVALLSGIAAWILFEAWPVASLYEWRATLKASAAGELDVRNYQVVNKQREAGPVIQIDFMKGEHFWNPQIAVWLEDTAGSYLETLFVTHSTAKGVFYGGRTSENFRSYDGKLAGEAVRRVDALPVWSHKRGVQYEDGYYSPPPTQPLPDGMSGATPQGNFLLRLQAAEPLPASFRVLLEVNVAFDENEYFSAYDFPRDTVYHGGTGQLGQPSLVYEVQVSAQAVQKYSLMVLKGHGHHSGQTGEVFSELGGITTAREIAERILVSFEQGN